jgi:hypothetical protein
MPVKTVIDGCRYSTYGFAVFPCYEVGYLGIFMVGMPGCQYAYEAKQPITEQVAIERRYPARVPPVKVPGNIGKELEAFGAQRYLFDMHS